MYQSAIQVLASDDFKKVTKVAPHIDNDSLLEKFPNVVFKTFLTKDSFYRPNDSEFLQSFVDTNGRTHELYALNFSQTILVLSQPKLGDYQHTLCTTKNEKGFYLDEVLELTGVFDAIFSTANS